MQGKIFKLGCFFVILTFLFIAMMGCDGSSQIVLEDVAGIENITKPHGITGEQAEDALPETVDFTLSNEEVVEADISWNTEGLSQGELDPGEYIITGTAVYDEISTDVVITIIIAEPPEFTLTLQQEPQVNADLIGGGEYVQGTEVEIKAEGPDAGW